MHKDTSVKSRTLGYFCYPFFPLFLNYEYAAVRELGLRWPRHPSYIQYISLSGTCTDDALMTHGKLVTRYCFLHYTVTGA